MRSLQEPVPRCFIAISATVTVPSESFTIFFNCLSLFCIPAVNCCAENQSVVESEPRYALYSCNCQLTVEYLMAVSVFCKAN